MWSHPEPVTNSEGTDDDYKKIWLVVHFKSLRLVILPSCTTGQLEEHGRRNFNHASISLITSFCIFYHTSSASVVCFHCISFPLHINFTFVSPARATALEARDCKRALPLAGQAIRNANTTSPLLVYRTSAPLYPAAACHIPIFSDNSNRRTIC